ncbi:MAG: putative Ig domain-containing protein [Candidatus Accumulibacter sp.]|nr:putative Ig domain-containing protein [Accumulibacter sp.]
MPDWPAPPIPGLFDDAQKYWQEVRIDPLALDLDGDGLETSNFNLQNPIWFDHDLNGSAEGTGWLNSDDGFLVLDRNGNGTIDDGSELFGDHTPLYEGDGTAVNGFAALAQEDTNEDGLVDNQDANWNDLRVWRDLNQDGISQSNELFTLSELGIQSLTVAAEAASQSQGNNQISATGIFTWEDSSEGIAGAGQAADIDFSVDTFHSNFTDTIELAEGVDELPDLGGSGLVRSLREAASQSTQVNALLTQFAQATTRAEQNGIIDQLLLAWADTSGLAAAMDDRDPDNYRMYYAQFGAIRREDHYVTYPSFVSGPSDGGSGGGSGIVGVLILPWETDVENDIVLDDEYRALIDSWSKRLHVLEAFNGRYFFAFPEETQAGGSARTGLSADSMVYSVGQTTSGGYGYYGYSRQAVAVGDIDIPITLSIRFQQEQLDSLGRAYDILRDHVYSILALQTRLPDLFEYVQTGISGTKFDQTLAALLDASELSELSETEMQEILLLAVNSSVIYGTIELLTELEDRIVSNPAEGVGDLLTLMRYVPKLKDNPYWASSSLKLLQNALAQNADNANIQAVLSDNFVKVANGSPIILYGNDSSGIAWNDILIGTAGADILNGGIGDDSLASGAGDDLLYGGAGDDVLMSGAGNDTLYGDVGDDILDGGAGNDLLNGGAGNDIFVFGTGYDHDTVITGDAATDKYDLIKLVDLMPEDVEFGILSAGSTINFQIRILETGETLTVMHGALNNYGAQIQGIEFADGSLMTWAQVLSVGLHATSGDDNLSLPGAGAYHAEGGNDTLFGSGGNDTLLGGVGHDVLYGQDGDDMLDGGAGVDYLIGGAGNDTFVFGIGYYHDFVTTNDSSTNKIDTIKLIDLMPEDIEFSLIKTDNRQDLQIRIIETGETLTIQDGASNGYGNQIQVIEFGDGTEWTWAQVTQAGMRATSANENLSLYQSGALYGEGGNDSLWGSSADDSIYGGDGSDTIFGSDGDDVIDGGAGIDYLYGGAGDDTFIFGVGYSHDFVSASDTGADKVDTIKLVGLQPEDVEFGVVMNNGYQDLQIRINATGETITVQSGASNGYGNQIQIVEFGDGTQWTWEQIVQAGLHATSANENLSLYQSGALYGEGGNDSLWGSSADDSIYGGDGSDTIIASDGDDVIDGGAGVDYLYGGTGDDTFIFGVGYSHDFVSASDNGADKVDTIKLVGLQPDDVEFGIVKNNGNQDFQIRINATGETMTVQSGASNGYGNQIQIVEFGDGTQWTWEEVIQAGLHATSGNDTFTLYQSGALYGEGGNDYLYGSSGSDSLTGGDGSDTIIAGGGDDVIDGGAGVDYLNGGTGNDTFVFGVGYGHDFVTINDNDANKIDTIKLIGLMPEDLEFGIVKNNTNQDFRIRINATGETITVQNGAASNVYGNQIQIVEFGDGTQWTWAEVVQSGMNNVPSGSLTLTGQAEQNQTLTISNAITDVDGLGAMSYQWQSSADGSTWTNLAGVTGTSYSLSQADVGQRIRVIASYTDGSGTAESVIGTSTSVIANVNDAPTGTVSLSGTLELGQTLEASHTLADIDGLGTVGYQWQRSANGSTWTDVAGATEATYVLGQGDAGKQIRVVASYIDGCGTEESLITAPTSVVPGDSSGGGNHAPTGSLSLTGQATQHQTLTVSSTLDDADGLGDLSYQWQYSLDGNSWADIDGATETSYTLEQSDVGQQIRIVVSYTDDGGTEEWVLGAATSAIADVNDAPVLATAITDKTAIAQAPFSFTLPGNAFTDIDPEDTLTYSATLEDGSALPSWLSFDAQTRTFQGTTSAAGSLNIQVTATDTAGASVSDVFALVIQAYSNTVVGTASGETLNAGSTGSAVMGLGGNDTLTGSNASDGLYGGDGNDSLIGNAGNDILDGGAGNDTLIGGAGNDTYVFSVGYGNDTVDTYETTGGKIDTIKLVDLAPEDVEFGIVNRNGNLDFQIRILETGETMTVLNGVNSAVAYQIQKVEFGDGTEWTWAQVLQASLHGTASGEALTLPGAGGLYGEGGNDSLYGSNANDGLYGGGGNDSLIGNGGNDVLDGGAGNDTLIGSAGNDTYVFGVGYGNDTVDTYETTSGKIDMIKLVDLAPEDVEFGIVNRSGNLDFQIRILETGETMTVLNGVNSAVAYQIQKVEFGDGTQWTWAQVLQANLHGTASGEALTLPASGKLYGEGGNDSLYGSNANDGLYGGDGNDSLIGNAGNDILDGGAGNDTLNGGAGNDTYVFGVGYGNDTVDTYETTGGKIDTIKLVDLAPEDVEFGIVNRSGNLDFQVRIKATNETMTVLNGVNSAVAYQIQKMEFGDGTEWTWAQVLQAGLHGTANAESLTLPGAGGLYGEGGNDTLSGSNANDGLYGGDGNDSLIGNAGNDILDGGAGNDFLGGGVGSDTYQFGAGWGQDSLSDYDATAGVIDKALFGEGIAYDQLWFQHVGNNLEVSQIGTSDKVTIQNWYSGAAYHVERFEVSSGQVLLDTQVEALVQAMASFSPPSAGETSLPQNYQDALLPVLAANWQA